LEGGLQKTKFCRFWWHLSIIPATREKEERRCDFKAKLGDVVSKTKYTWEAEIGRVTVRGQPRQKKIQEIPLQPIAGHSAMYLLSQVE
jgi:hypothetical protein